MPKHSKTSGTSWYWQPSKTLRDAGFEPTALGKDEGKAIMAARQLNEDVARWKAGGDIRAKVEKRRAAGTVAALVARYRKEYVNGTKPGTRIPRLKPKTREVYETGLKRIEMWAGDKPLPYVTPARVGVLRDKTAKPIEEGGLGHSAAFNLLSVLRQLFKFAESVDLIPKGTNPATEFGLAKPPPRNMVWTVEDDAAFDAAARELGWPSMALARELALYSAQREGDLIAFTEPQLQPLDILEPVLRERLEDENGNVMGWCLSQAKTSNEYKSVNLEIPIEPDLLGRIERAIRTNRARDRAADPPRLLTHVIVNDKTGLPWKQRHFIDVWGRILAHAAKATGRPHMRELVWHDLRRTRVVRLRRRGMPKEMIASLTGHSLRSIEEMLRVYGPVDPTITANAVVASLEPRIAKKDPSNKSEQIG
ncbi:hypothetical protein D2V07_03720 [Aurantiacibacter zhengii]|uniref:Tyr recombinase domain-containing protein n=1 Tax=Aurantiacibacter zhengii TaxID=2307003 RepID=A0A418NU77_9SPHN|nr:hypothetical protein D2V07_03720 [Aurantiacibacter zhengii]